MARRVRGSVVNVQEGVPRDEDGSPVVPHIGAEKPADETVEKAATGEDEQVVPIPEYLVIGGKRIVIKEGGFGFPLNRFGQYDDMDQLIQYNPNQGPDQLRDTILHEALHAIADDRGLSINEATIRSLAGGLLSLCRHNADLVAWVMEF